MSQTIEIRKVTPHCGAEIHGVDLSQPLDDATFAQIEKAHAEEPFYRP